MGDFEAKDYWKLYLNEEAKERVREIQDHLNQNYDNPSQFLRKKLEEEQALDLEERIKRAKQEKEQQEDKLERLKRIKQEREEQDRLRDKKELLKDKQEKLRKLSDRNGKDREAIRKEVEKEHLRNKPPRFSDEEYLEKKSDRIERIVDRRVDSSPDIDSLLEDVQRLQNQVEELNGGREEWFMDLGQDKLEAST